MQWHGVVEGISFLSNSFLTGANHNWLRGEVRNWAVTKSAISGAKRRLDYHLKLTKVHQWVRVGWWEGKIGVLSASVVSRPSFGQRAGVTQNSVRPESVASGLNPDCCDCFTLARMGNNRRFCPNDSQMSPFHTRNCVTSVMTLAWPSRLDSDPILFHL